MIQVKLIRYCVACLQSVSVCYSSLYTGPRLDRNADRRARRHLPNENAATAANVARSVARSVNVINISKTVSVLGINVVTATRVSILRRGNCQDSDDCAIRRAQRGLRLI